MTQREWLLQLLAAMAAKLGKTDFSKWKHKDFQELSQDIQAQTKVNISVTTLKRIYGSIETNELYFPHKSTLKALKLYSGFQEEEPLELNLTKQENEEAILDPFTVDKKHFESTSFFKKYKFHFGIAIILILGAWFLSTFKSSKNTLKLDKFTYNEELAVQTSTFYYEVAHADSFFITNNYDFKKYYLSPENHQINFFMGRPGKFYYYIIDKKGKTVSDSVAVLIPSNGWKAIVKYLETKSIKGNYEYKLDIKSLLESVSVFHPQSAYLAKKGIDTNEIYKISLLNYLKTPIAALSFDFEVDFKNSPQFPQVNCKQMELQIETTEGKIDICFNQSGCEQYVSMLIGKTVYNGTYQDLSTLTTDFTTWKNIRIKKQAETLQIYLNQQLISESPITQNLGDLVGVHIQFFGNGYVRNLKLTGKDGVKLVDGI